MLKKIYGTEKAATQLSQREMNQVLDPTIQSVRDFQEGEGLLSESAGIFSEPRRAKVRLTRYLGTQYSRHLDEKVKETTPLNE